MIDLKTRLRNLAYDARAFEHDSENQPGGFILEVAEALEQAATALNEVPEPFCEHVAYRSICGANICDNDE